jgi:hypothetical protein
MVVVGLGFREGDAKATRREKEKMDLMMEDGRREGDVAVPVGPTCLWHSLFQPWH